MIYFLQPIFLCVIYAATFATVSFSFATKRHELPSWIISLSAFIMMLLFIASLTSRLTDRSMKLGVTVGLWGALIGYPCFYNYPKIVESVPGAVSAYDELVLATQWLQSHWLTRFVLWGAACAFLFQFLYLFNYWASTGFGALLNWGGGARPANPVPPGSADPHQPLPRQNDTANVDSDKSGPKVTDEDIPW